MEFCCNICREKAKCRYFDLFVSGSEGIQLCHECEMLVIKFIREQAMAILKARLMKRIINNE